MTPYSIDELKHIIQPIAQSYGVERVMLFGSYARGEATSSSDIDLLVYGGDGFRTTRIFALAEDIRTATNCEVDLYEIREINPGTVFHQTVLREGLEIA